MAEIQFSEEFKNKIRTHWGEGSEKIVELAECELYRLDLAGGDWEDLVNNAKHIGIIAGETRCQNAEAFLERFEKWLIKYK